MGRRTRTAGGSAKTRRRKTASPKRAKTTKAAHTVVASEKPPVSDIRDAIPEIGRVLSEVLARGQQASPPEKLAIRAVWGAVDNTRMYIRMIENGQVRPEDPNPELVALWSDASLRLAEFDAELAVRLRDKAEYWSDPQRWQEQQIDDAGIGIDVIASDARASFRIWRRYRRRNGVCRSCSACRASGP